MWILKNIKTLKEYPKYLKDSGYNSIAKSAEIANFTAEKKQKFDRAMTFHENEQAVILTQYYLAKEEGKAEGKAEGKIEGAAERESAIAKAMLLNGIDVSVISTCTGLSIEQINGLRVVK